MLSRGVYSPSLAVVTAAVASAVRPCVASPLQAQHPSHGHPCYGQWTGNKAQYNSNQATLQHLLQLEMRRGALPGVASLVRQQSGLE